MLVEEIMKTNVITLSANNLIKDAVKLMKQHAINHIPIVNTEKNVIGIISDRDIRDALPSVLHKVDSTEDPQIPISSIMTKNVISAHPLDFVEELSTIFYDYKIGCVPIVDQNKLVGIVTKTDILYTLIQLTGANQPSSQIEVQVENVTGKLAEVASIIKKRNTNIISVLVYPGKIEGYKVLVFRVNTMNPTNVISDLQSSGYHVLWPNLPGVVE